MRKSQCGAYNMESTDRVQLNETEICRFIELYSYSLSK